MGAYAQYDISGGGGRGVRLLTELSPLLAWSWSPRMPMYPAAQSRHLRHAPSGGLRMNGSLIALIESLICTKRA